MLVLFRLTIRQKSSHTLEKELVILAVGNNSSIVIKEHVSEETLTDFGFSSESDTLCAGFRRDLFLHTPEAVLL